MPIKTIKTSLSIVLISLGRVVFWHLSISDQHEFIPEVTRVGVEVGGQIPFQILLERLVTQTLGWSGVSPFCWKPRTLGYK